MVDVVRPLKLRVLFLENSYTVRCRNLQRGDTTGCTCPGLKKYSEPRKPHSTVVPDKLHGFALSPYVH